MISTGSNSHLLVAQLSIVIPSFCASGLVACSGAVSEDGEPPQRDSNSCPDLQGQVCDPQVSYWCDDCSEVWSCFSVNHATVWRHTDWPCECVDEGGNFYQYDSADTGSSEDCRLYY